MIPHSLQLNLAMSIMKCEGSIGPKTMAMRKEPDDQRSGFLLLLPFLLKKKRKKRKNPHYLVFSRKEPDD